ncbi:MAG: glutathione S-transferase N-terminal domain-containing protein, partial [Bdellovibrionia bacterium]
MKLYVFKSLPPFLWGYTRDIRAMWALEECGIPYEPLGLDCGPNGLQENTSFGEINPFKQIPTIDDDGYILTETNSQRSKRTSASLSLANYFVEQHRAVFASDFLRRSSGRLKSSDESPSP